MDSIATTLVLLLILGISRANPITDVGVQNDTLSDGLVKEDITSTILRMNKDDKTVAFEKQWKPMAEWTDDLIEGDIMIPKTRNAMKCSNPAFSCYWPKSADGKVKIPYIISNKYPEDNVDEILNAMKDFKSQTCVEFIPRQSESIYISIEPQNGCSSLMGRVGDKQVVNLQTGGCVQKGIIQHELLHVLGFYHQHMRSDRDAYVHISWDNIVEGYRSNFNKRDTNNLNTPYDYNSILHYAGNAFSVKPLNPAQNTITPIPDASVAIGQRNVMSPGDVLRVNRLYACSE